MTMQPEGVPPQNGLRAAGKRCTARLGVKADHYWTVIVTAVEAVVLGLLASVAFTVKA